MGPASSYTESLAQTHTVYTVHEVHYRTLYSNYSGNLSTHHRTEPEFLNILKCDLAESASTGCQFICYDIFNDKTLNYKHLDHFLRTVKFTEKNLFYHKQIL